MDIYLPTSSNRYKYEWMKKIKMNININNEKINPIHNNWMFFKKVKNSFPKPICRSSITLSHQLLLYIHQTFSSKSIHIKLSIIQFSFRSYHQNVVVEEMRSRGSNNRLSSSHSAFQWRISSLILSMFATMAAFFVACR